MHLHVMGEISQPNKRCFVASLSEATQSWLQSRSIHIIYGWMFKTEHKCFNKLTDVISHSIYIWDLNQSVEGFILHNDISIVLQYGFSFLNSINQFIMP